MVFNYIIFIPSILSSDLGILLIRYYFGKFS